MLLPVTASTVVGGAWGRKGGERNGGRKGGERKGGRKEERGTEEERKEGREERGKEMYMIVTKNVLPSQLSTLIHSPASLISPHFVINVLEVSFIVPKDWSKVDKGVVSNMYGNPITHTDVQAA